MFAVHKNPLREFVAVERGNKTKVVVTAVIAVVVVTPKVAAVIVVRGDSQVN